MSGSAIVGITILAIAFSLLATAVWRRREGGLLAAVIAYAGITIYMVEGQPQLLAVTLALPIALAMAGLARFVSERVAL